LKVERGKLKVGKLKGEVGKLERGYFWV